MIPRSLKAGELIGVVSPARWLEDAKLQAAARVLEDAGFGVRIADQNHLRDGPFAGTDAQRARAIEEMFADTDVKAIVCARGGYGALRIADLLDYQIVRDNPKIFVGYSDITALLLAMNGQTDMVTYHGPMLVDMDDKPHADSIRHLIGTLTGDDVDPVSMRMTAAAQPLRAGEAEGRLVGGNLTILANLVGTRTDIDTAGAILFIEDVDEYLYNIDRLLVHLKRAGKLDRLAGLVMGSFTELKDSDTPFGRTVEEMVLEHCGDGAFPIVKDFPTGHAPANLTLPIGATARIEAGEDGTVGFSIVE